MGGDEEGTHERLQGHLRELVDPKVEEHRGPTVKNTGDGVLAQLQDPGSPLFLASACSIFASNRSNSIGLVSKSSQPLASAFSRSPAIACAVSAMIGMSWVAGSALRGRVASHPSISGRFRSIRIRSGCSAAAVAIPSAPLTALWIS